MHYVSDYIPAMILYLCINVHIEKGKTEERYCLY